MGAIWTTKNELITTTSEIVGYKSGLALTREKLLDYVPEDYAAYVTGSNAMIRIRAEEYEGIIAAVLYGVGNTPTPYIVSPVTHMYHKYKHDKAKLDILYEVLDRANAFLDNAVDPIPKESKKKAIDPSPLIDEIRDAHGLVGVALVIEFLEMLNLQLHQSSMGQIRRVDWNDTAELKDLFESESLGTLYGQFLDQRFIDYLQRNFSDIDAMNWRKFEGLTGEFFSRNGFEVEMGEGRNDGGIDARIWPSNVDKSLPPALLVQCKRQKDKVEKVVVKGLYADILAEEAESGLIVTTSCLSPGAETTCKVRGYPIRQANRKTLKQWIEAMRSPWAGVWLGE